MMWWDRWNKIVAFYLLFVNAYTTQQNTPGQQQQEETQAYKRATDSTMVYLSSDNSPQRGWDWEIHEVTLVHNAVSVFLAIKRMVSLLPDAMDMDDWGKWVDSLDDEQRKTVQRLHQKILDAGMKHVWIPTILGARHSGFVQKVHSLLRAAKTDTGTWQMVTRVMA